jgi:peptidoglycan/LPS O-acetylase OafA/YrhL
MASPIRSATLTQTPRLAFLDVARCLAALLVLVEHAMNLLFPDFQKSTVGFAVVGKVGVILFFVISGFIIPQSLQQGGSYLRFWLRRAFRLYPVYWLSIGMFLLYCCRTGTYQHLRPDFSAADWLINMTMLQGFITGKNVWGIYWTLQYELIFYVVCTFLCMAEWLKYVRYIAIIAFAVFALGELVAIFGRDSLLLNITSPTLVLLAPLVGFAAQQYASGLLSGRSLTWIIAAQFAAFVGVWYAGYMRIGDQVTMGTLEEFAITWGVAYAIFFALFGWRHRRMPAVLCYLGLISYSIYLLHLGVMQFLIDVNMPIWSKLLSWLVLTIGLAAVSFHAIERPGISMGRWIERLKSPSLRRPVKTRAPVPVPAQVALPVVLRRIR